ncbi:MAG: matrixin family metalloprotease [Halobellus sp.]|uniref:matrixin family metalloprotease n=1 Tax=Halobellus sp. TaxID=1979212 RepID=UPI0035D4BB62
MRTPRTAVVGVVLLLTLAGCVGPVGDLPVDVPSTTTPSDGTPASTAPTTGSNPGSDTVTSEGTPSPTPTAAPDRESPWGSEPIVVAVHDTAGSGRNWTPLVREATAYWEAEAERLAGFPVTYTVRPDADDPDIVLEFVDAVPRCEGSDDAAGCAPLIENRRQIDRPETVSIRTGFSNESTVRVVEHELGHTLGLTHEDAPQVVMASRTVLYTEPQPDATERAFPWDDANFSVYVDVANASDPDGARRQVKHALNYYETGAPGMPANITFTTVERAEAADIVVQLLEASPCGPEAASCGRTVGRDPDGDGAVETYSTLRISLIDLDTNAVAWHTGYWLAYGLGAEDESERPSPFRDAPYEERRSEWWT